MPSGQVLIRWRGSTALTTSKMVISFGGFAFASALEGFYTNTGTIPASARKHPRLCARSQAGSPGKSRREVHTRLSGSAYRRSRRSGGSGTAFWGECSQEVPKLLVINESKGQHGEWPPAQDILSQGHVAWRPEPF
jgi:hypothetical protein